MHRVSLFFFSPVLALLVLFFDVYQDTLVVMRVQ